MATRKVQFAEGEFYHIYNRGNSKQQIFLDEKDYKHFIKLLYICNSEKQFNFRDNIRDQHIDAFDFEVGSPLVSIGAYTLMPNHFHIYLTISPKAGVGEKRSMNNVSLFMGKVSTAYAKYFNYKYKRTGGLFEGRFKFVHIKNDTQAKYLFSYIHLNCIKLVQNDWKEVGITNKKQALEFLKKYKWSSYLDHKKQIRPENKILTLKSFPRYFNAMKDFDDEILSWLTY